MMDPEDLEVCREAIRHGSHSFYAASKVLPARVRDPALALYAFCRLADDAVDLQKDKHSAVLSLRDRLDLIYQGRPRNAAADRAFAGVIESFEMPRALPDALLEGLAWDAMDQRYDSLSDLKSYCARVASAVGVMMCVLMRVRDGDALARAADLGVAMQLTNIARDVGEDALEQRLYLPQDWMHAAGLPPERFLERPEFGPEVRGIVERLLREAERLYQRSEAGISKLPLDCRFGILAARHIYAAIGRDVARAGHDSITRRAHTTKGQKLALLGKSLAHSVLISVMPQSAVLHARSLPEVTFLVEAATREADVQGRSSTVLDTLAQLEAQDREKRNGFSAVQLSTT